MPFDNEAAKRGLIQLLRGSRRALLLVGAGSSIPVGYPSWPQLLEELRAAVVPELTQFPDVDLLSRAELIQTTLLLHPITLTDAANTSNGSPAVSGHGHQAIRRFIGRWCSCRSADS